MCGLTGILTSARPGEHVLAAQASAMTSRLAHRGPDDAGLWTEPSAGVALGFRRLSIVDLSASGHQPMRSASGRYTIVFNGEVYNHVELRPALERDGHRFRGHSDTEVILAAFDRWGIEAAVRRFLGMFAMAVWDAERRELSLVRDRLGVKPLYCFHRPGLLLFGSELKALLAHPQFDRTVDREALDAYFRHLYVPGPRSIFRDTRKLAPGHILTVRDASAALPPSVPYWSLDDAYATATADPFTGSDAEAMGALDALVADSVRLRMRADVPYGALLSGGVDSSLVVAMMTRCAPRPVRTFSIGFPGTVHDESAHAREVARALGTDHTALDVTDADARDVVPLLPDIFDEPQADPSQIPTYLVCRLARTSVTVALSGDGGDEVFAGYERYVRGAPTIGRLARLPAPVRRLAGAGIGVIPDGGWDLGLRVAQAVFPPARRQRLVGQKARKLGRLLREGSENAMYLSLLSVSPHPLGAAPPAASMIDGLLQAHRDLPLLDRMMLVDQQTYLPEDLLAKLDRASMAVGLEAREPLLDHRLFEFGWRLPASLKVRAHEGKWLLRQVLHAYVDPALMDRPKTGFTVPIAGWLRGALREWGESLVFDARGEARDYLDVPALHRAWHRLQSGDDAPALSLWAVLMFMAWHERWMR